MDLGARKFIFIHLYNDRSGSPKVLSQVVRAAIRRNVDVEILTSVHTDGFLSDLPAKKTIFFYRRSESKFFTLLLYFISQISLFITCLRFWRQDVLFYVNTMMPVGAAVAAKVMRKQVIYHVHETSVRPAIFKRFLRFGIFLTASKVIFVSNYLRRVEGFKNKSQYVVYNALDCVGSVVESKPDIFTVLMVCSLKKYKGVFEFFAIAQLFLYKGSIRFVLVLNADQHEIDGFFVGVNIPSNVDIYHRQAEVGSFYSEASLVFNLSRPDECVETFGLTILEAMSYGLPVIVPPVGGPAEIVTDGKEGFLISCYDVQKISDAIELLSSDSGLYQQISRNARARAAEFNIDSFEQEICSIVDLQGV